MSGPSSSDYNFAAAVHQPPIPTSDSRLLDAAETLVTLQSRGNSRSRSSVSPEDPAKSRSVYLTPHQQQAYKMAPQPPTSVGTSPTSMGPPPPPPPSSGDVTFLLINQDNSQQTHLMRPPVDPPPRRGRGRGRGRGSSSSLSESSGRGRGRGRGRGASKVQSHPIEHSPDPMESNQDDVEMMLVDAAANDLNKDVFVKEETFMVGDMELKDSIFDEVLNKKKMELMMDPEIIALFANHQRSLKPDIKK